MDSEIDKIKWDKFLEEKIQELTGDILRLEIRLTEKKFERGIFEKHLKK